MIKYVYIIWQYNCEPGEEYWNGIHKCFDTLEAAEAYLKANKGKVFPEDKEPWEHGYRIGGLIRKHKLLEEQMTDSTSINVTWEVPKKQVETIIKKTVHRDHPLFNIDDLKVKYNCTSNGDFSGVTINYQKREDE